MKKHPAYEFILIAVILIFMVYGCSRTPSNPVPRSSPEILPSPAASTASTKTNVPDGDNHPANTLEQQIEDQFNQGEIHFRKREYDKAEKIFQQILEEHPESEYGYIGMSIIHGRLKRFDRSEIMAKKALEINPDSFSAWFCLENLYNDTRVARYKDAVKVCARLLELKPDDFDANMSMSESCGNLGDFKKQLEYTIKAANCVIPRNQLDTLPTIVQVLYREEEHDRIEALLKRELKRFPDAHEIYTVYGNYRLKMGKYDEAGKFLEKALEMNPNFQKTYVKLAELYYDRGEYGKALDIITRGSKVRAEDEEEDLELHTETVKILLALGRRDEAEKILDGLIDYAGETYGVHIPVAYIKRAELYTIMKKYDKAVDSYRKALKEEPSRIDAYVGLSRTLAQAGKKKEALDWLKKAESKLPEDPELALELGEQYARLGELDRALKIYEKLLKLYPDRPDAVLHFSETLVLQGKRKEALDFLEKASAKSPDNEDILLNLSEVYMLMDRKMETAKTLKKLLKVSPGHPEAITGLAEVYLEEGKKDEIRKLARRLEKGESGEEVSPIVRAELYYMAGDLEKAQEILGRPEVSQGGGKKYLLQAKINLSRGDIKKGLANMREAFRVDPELREKLPELKSEFPTLIKYGKL